MSDTTVDVLFDGRILIEQYRSGYRFNVDSVLLAAFAHQHVGRDIVDVGAGAGPLGLALAMLDHTRRVLLVERQASLATLLQRNVVRNDLADRCEVLCEDIRQMRGRPHHFDGAVMNPPYFSVGSGHESPGTERALARHEKHGDIAALVASAARHLYDHAPLCVVFPAQRSGALFSALDRARRRQIICQWVHPMAGAPASLLLVAARASDTHTMVVPPPLNLHDAARCYTETAGEIVATGHWPTPS